MKSFVADCTSRLSVFPSLLHSKSSTVSYPALRNTLTYHSLALKLRSNIQQYCSLEKGITFQVML